MMPKQLRGDRDVVLEAVKRDGLDLAHATDELRADLNLVLEAVKQNGLALKFAAPHLLDNHMLQLFASTMLQHDSESNAT